MIGKGDIVLVTSPINKFAGFTGKVKRLRKKSKKAIVKICDLNVDTWIMLEDLIKI